MPCMTSGRHGRSRLMTELFPALVGSSVISRQTPAWAGGRFAEPETCRARWSTNRSQLGEAAAAAP